MGEWLITYIQQNGLQTMILLFMYRKMNINYMEYKTDQLATIETIKDEKKKKEYLDKWNQEYNRRERRYKLLVGLGVILILAIVIR